MILTTLATLFLAAQVPSGAPKDVDPHRHIESPTQAQLGKVDLARAKSLAPLLLSKAARFHEGGKEPPSWFGVRPPEVSIPHVAEGGGVVILNYGVGRVFFSRNDGELSSILLDRSAIPEREPTLGEEECKRLALEFYRFCGGKKQMVFFSAKLSDEGRSYDFGVTPTLNGVPFFGGGTWIVDRGTGCIQQMVMKKSSVPVHGSAVPGVSAEQARTSMTEAMGRFGRYARMVVGGPVLWLQVPRFSNTPNEMLPLHHALEREEKATLLYHATFYDADSWSTQYNLYMRGCDVYVDAYTGRTISIVPIEDYTDLYAADARPRAKTPFAWSFPKGALALVSGKRTVKVPQGKVAPAPEPDTPPQGERIILGTPEGALLASFDRASGLVWVEISGKRHYGKPNPSLLKALRTLKSNGTKGFGSPKG